VSGFRYVVADVFTDTPLQGNQVVRRRVHSPIISGKTKR